MTVALVAPILMLLVMGGVLAWQISRMADAAEWVTHTDAVMARMYETRSELAEKESALRAWLLVGDRELLAPYEAAGVSAGLDDLIRETADNPVQTARLEELKELYGQWTRSADSSTKQAPQVARDDQNALRTRVHVLARAREQLEAAVNEELSLLRARQSDNATIERTAKGVFVVLLVMSAAMIGFVSRKQLGAVSKAFEGLIGAERGARKLASDREWVQRGEAQVGNAVLGERSVAEVATQALEALVTHTGAVVGAVYQARGTTLHRVATNGLGAGVAETLAIDQGQTGLAIAAKAPRLVRDAELQLDIDAGIAKKKTVRIAIVPAMIEGRTIGVVILGFEGGEHELEDRLYPGVSVSIALAMRAADQRTRLQELLEETQRQGEELQAQHEELRVTNEELEHQGSALREAYARQENTQHELEAANANLEEQTATLEQQREELLRVQKDLQHRARELQMASQYKSEFLARMSHELRTPLNSSLILARLLADNPNGNLTEEQVKFANTIYAAGNDLLLLINDILDLAKIEAGRLELRLGTTSLSRIRDSLLREFEPVAQQKHLGLAITIAAGTPEKIHSDDQRIVQVLRNLLSNACKFTERGTVQLEIHAIDDHVRFSVKDSGIGIPPDQLEKVFEAFHQVDGSVARKHGGTGLGLAISRDLAHLLGGTLTLDSVVGRGSTFSLTIPQQLTAEAKPVKPEPMTAPLPPVRRQKLPTVQPLASPSSSPVPAPGDHVDDDRDHLEKGKRTLLVIEDDIAFATVERDLARELDFQVLVAHTADEGVDLALRHRPDGILCDIKLPDHSGLSVLERIKRQPEIRHVPIHMISVDDFAQRALELGAVGYLLKPATIETLTAAIKRIEDRTSRSVRRLLIVEDDEIQSQALDALLGGRDVEISSTGTIKGALELLGKTTFDCVVMDLRLADGTGFELLEKMTEDDRITFPPVIVHTGKDLTDDEEAKLRNFSSSIIVKGARSPERLVDEVTLFLHQVESELPPERQRLLQKVRSREAIFEGRSVLIVEDDIRNVFALTSILEPRGLRVVVARNGKEALTTLDKESVDLVLMDVMMPEMDGIEATRRIRTQKKFDKLPIISLTAKAMADDREKCLDAGANDYLAKPIDIDMLLSLMRVWMPR